jgi:hypothetical protein
MVGLKLLTFAALLMLICPLAALGWDFILHIN